MQQARHILLATLGYSSELVIQALDGLEQRGYLIDQVVVLHTDLQGDPRLQEAIHTLVVALSEGRQRSVTFHPFLLRKGKGQTIGAIQSDEDAEEVLVSLRDLMGKMKRDGLSIHCLLAGGDRLVAFLVASQASMLFSEEDHLWDVSVQEAASEKIPGSGSLSEVPLLLFRKLLTNVVERPLNAETQEPQRAEEMLRCNLVVKRVSPAQRRVLEGIARGLSLEEVAQELGIKLRTVHYHRRMLLEHCRDAWNLLPNTPLTYQFLQEKFRNFRFG